jgi:hypothetical protein
MKKDNIPIFLEAIFVFVAGSAADPRPVDNKLSERLARDLDHGIIVHFSQVLRKWGYDDGAFHTGCRLEFPVAWLPSDYILSETLEAQD